MARKGRSAAVLLGAVSAAVLAGGAVLFRTRIVEEWYLWKLRSADLAESDRAALKLGAMGSLRAVEPLIEAIQRDETEVAVHAGRGVRLSPRAYALYRLGAQAFPAIERVRKKEPPTQSWAILFEITRAIRGEYPSVTLGPRVAPIFNWR